MKCKLLKQASPGAPVSSFFPLIVLSILFFSSLTACGRRADPFLPPPHEEITAIEDAESRKEEEKEPIETLREDVVTGEEETPVAHPDPPDALQGLYTGKSIVLTWGEVLNQGVTSYRIYRSEGEGFILTGEAVTPAFIDREIEKDRKYYYKVTAFGQSESDPSEEVVISTESD